MTSSTNASPDFNGVAGGKVQYFDSTGIGQGPLLKGAKTSEVLWLVAGSLGLVVAIASAITFATIGFDKQAYDFSSSDFVTYTSGNITSWGILSAVTLAATFLLLTLLRHDVFAAIVLAAIFIVAFFVSSDTSSAFHPRSAEVTQNSAALESWLSTNKGLVPDDSSTAVGNFSFNSLKAGTVIPLVDENGKSVSGLFTKSGDNRYVFSRLEN